VQSADVINVSLANAQGVRFGLTCCSTRPPTSLEALTTAARDPSMISLW
jgi:hypothetical protein